MNTFDVVENWLNNVAYSHSRSKGTPSKYRTRLAVFCSFINASPEQIKAEYDTLDEKQYKRKYGEILRAFISHLSVQEYAPNTVNSYVVAVKSFFKYNDLPLAFVPTAKTHVLYHNRDITKEEIQQILAVSNPREKAFFAMMAQSGLRPETLCNLQVKDIEPDFSSGVIPCRVNVPQEAAKGKYHAYLSFIGEESINYLRQYLNSRRIVKKDEKTGKKTYETPKLQASDFLFTSMGLTTPANSSSMSKMFIDCIRKLRDRGVISFEVRKHKPSELRLYSLRKYFSKNAGQMGTEEKEFMMGHTQGVRDHYLAQDPEHYRKLYAEKAMPFLRFEEATPTEVDVAIARIKEEKDKEIAELKSQIEKLQPLMNFIDSFDTQEKLSKFFEMLKGDYEFSSPQGTFIHSNLPHEQMEVLKRVAAKTGTSVSDLIENSVKLYAEMPDRMEEMAKDRKDKTEPVAGKRRKSKATKDHS
jgi:integrase/uncharacterized protein YeeX (DUF496 family)